MAPKKAPGAQSTVTSTTTTTTTTTTATPPAPDPEDELELVDNDKDKLDKLDSDDDHAGEVPEVLGYITKKGKTYHRMRDCKSGLR